MINDIHLSKIDEIRLNILNYLSLFTYLKKNNKCMYLMDYL